MNNIYIATGRHPSPKLPYDVVYVNIGRNRCCCTLFLSRQFTTVLNGRISSTLLLIFLRLITNYWRAKSSNACSTGFGLEGPGSDLTNGAKYKRFNCLCFKLVFSHSSNYSILWSCMWNKPIFNNSEFPFSRNFRTVSRNHKYICFKYFKMLNKLVICYTSFFDW